MKNKKRLTVDEINFKHGIKGKTYLVLNKCSISGNHVAIFTSEPVRFEKTFMKGAKGHLQTVSCIECMHEVPTFLRDAAFRCPQTGC